MCFRRKSNSENSWTLQDVGILNGSYQLHRLAQRSLRTSILLAYSRKFKEKKKSLHLIDKKKHPRMSKLTYPRSYYQSTLQHRLNLLELHGRQSFIFRVEKEYTLTKATVVLMDSNSSVALALQ